MSQLSIGSRWAARWTFDVDRLIQYADPNETLLEFALRARREIATGGQVVWTANVANVGRVTKR